MKKQTLELKKKASNLYYELRKLGLSHSMALAAVVEAVIEGSDALGVASDDADRAAMRAWKEPK